MIKTGAFVVRDGGLFPLDEKSAECVKADGQVFAVSLDDERPINNARRAALFAWVRDWSDSMPNSFNRNFMANFLKYAYCPVDEKLIVDFLKTVYGIKSIADGAISDARLAEFFAFVQERCGEIGAAARAADMDTEGGDE